MFGGTLFMFVGGLHYWWPKITGRMYNESLGRLCCLLELLAFNLTFFPQFILGLHGMPRRSAVYYPEFQYLHVLSSIGAFIQMAAFLVIAAYLLHSLFRGKKAPANPGAARPWNGVALRRRRTTTFPRRPPSAGPTTTAAWSGTKRRKDMSGRQRSWCPRKKRA